MSTWEERMGAKARARREAEAARQRAPEEAERAAVQAAQAAEHAAQRVRLVAEGRPCEACYQPEPVESWSPWQAVWVWAHVDKAFDRTFSWYQDEAYRLELCNHACHGGEPYCVNPPPIAYAAG